MDLYTKKKREEHSGDTASMAAECAEMLRRQPPEDINKIQKTWYTLSKGDSAKDKDVYSNAKVLFLKLCVYHNKLKKLQVRQQSHGTSLSSCDSRETGNLPGRELGRSSSEQRELGRNSNRD